MSFYLDQGCFTYLTEAPQKVGFIWIKDVLPTLLKLHTKWVLLGSGMFYLPYWSSTQSGFYLDQGCFYLPYWSSTQSEFYLDQGCFTYLTEALHKVGFIWIRDVLPTLLKLHTKWVLFGSGMFYLPYWSSTQSESYLDQGCFTYLTEAPHKVSLIWIRDVLLTLLKLHTKYVLFGSGMFYLPYWSSTQSVFYLDQGCFTYLTEAPYKVGFIWIRDVLLTLLKLHTKWVLLGSGMSFKLNILWNEAFSSQTDSPKTSSIIMCKSCLKHILREKLPT